MSKHETSNVSFRVRDKHRETFKVLVRERVIPELKQIYRAEDPAKQIKVKPVKQVFENCLHGYQELANYLGVTFYCAYSFVSKYDVPLFVDMRRHIFNKSDVDAAVRRRQEEVFGANNKKGGNE